MHIEVNRNINPSKERSKIDSEIAAVREAVASVSESSEKLISSLVKEVDQNIDSEEKAIRFLTESGWLEEHNAEIYNKGLGDSVASFRNGHIHAEKVIQKAFEEWKKGNIWAWQDFEDVLAMYSVETIEDILMTKEENPKPSSSNSICESNDNDSSSVQNSESCDDQSGNQN